MLVSVIIPSYNHELYILEAINSVLSQDYRHLELIVIDDGSKDNSVDLIKSIKDNRLLLIEQENQGAHAAINRGLNLAQGDFLTILNSDDVYSVDRVHNCLESLERNNTHLVCSWLNVVDQNGKKIGLKKGWKNMLPRWAAEQKENGYWSGNDFALNLLTSNFVSTTSNIFFTRHLFEKIGGMKNLRFAHDWDFMLRAAAQFECGIISKPLVNYRIHGTNTIKSNQAWMMFEICWVLARNIDNFRDKIYQGTDFDGIKSDLDLFLKSLNFNGYDRLFWILKDFIQINEAKGIDTDKLLLEGDELRNHLIGLFLD